MAELKRMIEIGIDARPAKAGAADVEKSMGKVVESTEKAKKELERLDKVLGSLQEESKGAKSEVDRLDTTIDKLDTSAKQTTSRLDRMEQSLLDTARNTRQAQIELERLNTTNNKLAGTVDFVKSRILGLVAGISALAVVRKVFTSVRDFEAGLIGVAKTTDLAGSELTKFGSDIAQLSATLGSTQKELLEIAQSAGQLGVRGSANLLKFTETVAKLGTASNLSGNEGATTLARLLNVTGESVDTVDKLAAVIVALGNKSAATEAEIAHVAESVAQASAVFRVSSADAAAFGATLASFGQEARLAGSVVGRAMRAIDQTIRQGGESLEALATLTGRTSEEITSLFRADATKGLEAFLRGLKAVINSGGDAAAELEKFGLSGDEVLKVLPALALQVDYLSDRIVIARDEVEKGQAANKEYEKFAESLKVQIQALGATIAASFTENLKDALPFITNTVRGTAELIKIMTGLKPITEQTSVAMRVLATTVRLAVEALIALTAVKLVSFFGPMLVNVAQATAAMNGFRAAVVAVSITTAASGPLAGGLAAVSLGIRGIGIAIKSLFLAIGPAGWVILGITTVIELFDLLSLKGDGVVVTFDKMRRGAVDLGDSLDRVQTSLAELSRGEAFGDLGEQAQALRSLANELGRVDIDLTKGLQEGNAGFVKSDQLAQLLRTTEGKAELDRLTRSIRDQEQLQSFLRNGASPVPPDAFALPAGLAQPQAKVNISATDAIKLLRSEVTRTNEEAKRLQSTMDEIATAKEVASEQASAEKIIESVRTRLEQERELLGLSDEARAQIQVRRELEQAAAKAEVTLGEDKIKSLEELASSNVKLATEIEKRTRAEAEAIKLAERQQEERNKAVDSLNDLISKSQQETQQLSLTGEARNAYIAKLQVEAIARDHNIDNLDEYISLLEKELNAQDALRLAQEEQRKADETAKRLAEQRDDASKSITDSFEALDFELGLIGKTNDARERAIELVKLQGLAEIAYADNLEQAAQVLEAYERRLHEIQQQRALQQLADDIGNAFAETFESIIFDAKSLEDAFESLIRNISRLLFQELVTKQIASNLASILGGAGDGGAGGIFAGLFGGGSAQGNMFRQGTAVQAFEKGGIIDQPVNFAMSGNRVGIAGEKGPEWAIAPLERGPGGKLGAHVMVDQPQSVTNVTMYVNTPNADSFNQSRSQVMGGVRRVISNRR